MSSPKTDNTGHRTRIVALVVTLLIAICCGIFAVGSSNADFSDTRSGAITGTISGDSVRLQTTGGTGVDNMDVNWSNMLPHVWKSLTITYKNVGNNPIDVTAKFDSNPTALSALNDLGHYGAAQVYGGTAGTTLLFDSQNLSDHATCPNTPATDCRPLPGTVSLMNNLAPGDSAIFTLKFMYTSKLTAQPAAGTTVPFNAYPALDGQTIIRPQDGTGSGLPVQLVATQRP